MDEFCNIRLYLIALLLITQSGISQSIGINTNDPDSTAALDINADNRGLLIPRLTTLQRSAISNPAVGLQIYNTDIQCLQFFNGTEWMNCCGTPEEPVTQADAGTDRTTTQDTVHLNGNDPGLGETGVWTIITGAGGSFSDTTDPHAVFSSNGNFATYILRWTIFNPCGNTYDEVEIRFYRTGVYVSYLGSDMSGDGSPGNPYKTIQKGIDESLNDVQDMVFISEGTFHESLTINNPGDSIHVLGGHYAYDWNIQDGVTHATVMFGGVTAVSVSNTGGNTVTIEDMGMHSSKATSGNNSIVMFTSSAEVSVISCALNAGDGGPGSDGTDGTDGQNGSPGSDGNTGDCFNQPLGGTGGAGGTQQTSGGAGGVGGNGTNENNAGPNGMSGVNGSGSNGGQGGAGGAGVGPCMGGMCNTSGFYDGYSGNEGGNGIDGAGGTMLNITAGMLISASGSSGNTGSGAGGGGGGGGCGGLQDCGGGGSGFFGYGHSGAGGGGGGGAGSGGAGGTGGGSSIGVLALNTDLTVLDSYVYKGAGGNGGSGGKGGAGGQGGIGGSGLFESVDGVFSISGAGGTGGTGGRGGHGGGGMGGSSIGIATNGGSLNQMNNTFIGGTAGSGGKSLGQDGAPGILSNIYP